MQGKALEVMTSPMVSGKLLEKANWDKLNEELVIVNAISSDRDRMRPSMVPSILEAVSLNQKNFSRFSFFEVGRSYLPDTKNFSTERSQVVLAYFDKKESRFLEARNVFENMMNYIKIPFQIVPPSNKFPNPLLPENWTGVHPNEVLNINVMGKTAGTIFTVHPIVLRDFKIKGNLVLAVLDTTEAEVKPAKEKTKYQPLPKFPSSTFDCTVLADRKTPAEEVIKAAKKLKVKEIESIKVVDVFYPNDSDQKGVTIRAVFMDREKTLTGEFIKETEDKLLETLNKEGFPLKV